MYISYKEFCNLLLKHIYSGEGFYLELLQNVIKNPERYCGLFRVSNAKTKMIQNVTQSNEIKFGDAIEELTTEYIKKMGYTNFDKNLGEDEDGNLLNVDQYFSDGRKIYIAEMKIRDDHDSTKKRGQYENFRKKVILISNLNKNKEIDASMWFVDSSLVKNKNFYKSEIIKENFENCSLHLYYGDEFFLSLQNGKQAWNEFIDSLTKYRIENSNEDIEIPDFGSSEEIYQALLKLPLNYWNKLNSSQPKYVLLRKELFSSGNNLEKAKLMRKKY